MKYMVSVVISPCILPRANLPHLLLSAFFQDRFLLWSLRTIDSLFVSMGTIHVMKFCGIDNVVELLLSWNMVMISNYFCFDCSYSFFFSLFLFTAIVSLCICTIENCVSFSTKGEIFNYKFIGGCSLYGLGFFFWK